MSTDSQQDQEGSQSSGLRWYIIQIATGYEKKVSFSLKERVELAKMEHLFGEIMVPTEEVVEMKGGKKQQSKKRFFPGYMLLEMIMTDETWHLVNQIPNVRGFVGGSRKSLLPLSDAEIDDIHNRIKAGADKPRPKIVFEVGEVIRIIEGPFADFNAVVEDVNFSKSKLRVSVLIFGRSTPVELEFSQVEKSHEAS